MTQKYRCRFAGVLSLLATLFFLSAMAQAQTMTILHSFTLMDDGGIPQNGITFDQHGAIYGVTQYGGDRGCDLGGVPGCGVLYRLKHMGSGWIVSTLHEFHDGAFPITPGVPTVGPNGTVFGVTWRGGINGQGLIYNATPLPRVPPSGVAFWNYNTIYRFTDGSDGGYPSPYAPLRFDAAGNFYGSAGGQGGGVIYKMTPAGSGWLESVLYNFNGTTEGSGPEGPVFDSQGNMYGVNKIGGNSQQCGNYGCGTIFQLTNSGSGWTETTLFTFREGVDGGWPGPLIRDAAGNLYGITTKYGPQGGGTVWELSPSGGGWTFNLLYSFPLTTVGDYGPYALAMDPAGNLYGVSNWGGANNTGFLFKLAPSNGSWIYTDLWDFTERGGTGAGCYPQGAPLLDAQGNLYGAAEECGEFNDGTVWMFTP